MSYQAMAWATEQDMPAMQKIVLLMMANRTNHDTGLCFPAHSTLAKECGMAKRTLIEQLNKLESAGFIEVLRSVNDNGVKNTNRYRLNMFVSTKQGSESAELGVVSQPHYGSEPTALGVVSQPHYGSEPTALGVVSQPHYGSEPTALGVVSQPHIEPVNINQEINQTKLSARTCEKISDDSVFDQPLQWAQFFITECGYPLHIVQTAKTIPMFAEWVRLGYSIGLIRQAMSACHAWNGGRVPDTPMLYRKFLQSILDEQKRLAAESAFADRPGAGRIQAIDEWAKIPKVDDDLWPWAKQHGYPGPGSKTYRQYRSFLNDEVEKRLRTRRREVAG